MHLNVTTAQKKATIHKVTTMLATPKNVLFPGHNHLLTTGTNDLKLWLSLSHHFDYHPCWHSGNK